MVLRSAAPAIEPPHLDSPASPHSVVDAWNLLLGPQQPGERAALLHEVESMSSRALVTLALLALLWGHGVAVASCVFRLCRCSHPPRQLLLRLCPRV